MAKGGPPPSPSAAAGAAEPQKVGSFELYNGVLSQTLTPALVQDGRYYYEAGQCHRRQPR